MAEERRSASTKGHNDLMEEELKFTEVHEDMNHAYFEAGEELVDFVGTNMSRMHGLVNYIVR